MPVVESNRNGQHINDVAYPPTSPALRASWACSSCRSSARRRRSHSAAVWLASATTEGGASNCHGSTFRAVAMRSNVGNEGREIVADTVDCFTPNISANSFWVIPRWLKISLIYVFMLQRYIIFILYRYISIK